MAIRPGTKLGQYEIIAPLGAGGMGEVYRARDVALKREVAIKILPQAYSSDAQRLHRFQQEAEATATLNHPNVLSLYHVGEHNGCPYLVTELLEGGDTAGKASRWCATRAQGDRVWDANRPRSGRGARKRNLPS